ncbi:MAG: TerB family tellurite resistance protein [Aestuariibacter sp.]
MRFEQYLRSLDMGRCEDQLQRQALLDLAVLFMAIDGDIKDSEERVLKEWLDTIPWSSETTVLEYHQRSVEKALHALESDDVEDYIGHHAGLLIDADTKQQALHLAEAIANADDELDNTEANAIAILRSALD